MINSCSDTCLPSFLPQAIFGTMSATSMDVKCPDGSVEVVGVVGVEGGEGGGLQLAPLWGAGGPEDLPVSAASNVVTVAVDLYEKILTGDCGGGAGGGGGGDDGGGGVLT